MVFWVATASLSTVESSARRRPHRSLPHRATPATVYQARPKANPGTRTDTHDRVSSDRVDEAGSVTLRVAGRLHHIGVGRTHARTRDRHLVPAVAVQGPRYPVVAGRYLPMGCRSPLPLPGNDAVLRVASCRLLMC